MTVCKVSFLILHASFHNIYLPLHVAVSMWTNASEMRRLDQILAQLCLFKTYWLSNNSDDRRMFDQYNPIEALESCHLYKYGPILFEPVETHMRGMS